MTKLKEFITSMFDMWVQKRWLKTIDKSIRRRDRLMDDYRREVRVLGRLVTRYNELYEPGIDISKGV